MTELKNQKSIPIDHKHDATLNFFDKSKNPIISDFFAQVASSKEFGFSLSRLELPTKSKTEPLEKVEKL